MPEQEAYVRKGEDRRVDVVVVGAGAAGITCATHAARAGARVLLLEKDTRLGGALHLSGGHLAAAGTARQRDRGIADTVAAHRADVVRISQGTARMDLVDVVLENAATTIALLEEGGIAWAPEAPRIVYGHEPYATPRTVYGPDGGIAILAVLEGELERALARTQLELWTGAAVTELIADGAGSVVGVVVQRGGTEARVQASYVVLATGGYGADPELFEELEGAPLVSAAARTATGDGLHLARSAGAALQGAGTYLPTFGGLPDPVSPGRANWHDRQRLTSERPPWEIYVDRSGRRWVAEDEDSIDEKERALTRLADQTFWTVFDDLALDHATGEEQIVVGKEPDEVRAMANTRPGVHSAGSLEELAASAGIDAVGLAETVRTYNAAVSIGVDEEFGRRHLPVPIAQPPFYALRNHGITLVTFQGVDVDAECAVRAEEGSLVEGLFAVGEVIGAGATCGNSFCSGMLLTPALTLGRLLGERLAAELGRSVTG